MTSSVNLLIVIYGQLADIFNFNFVFKWDINSALSQKMVTKISVGKLISGVRELTKSVGELSYGVSMLVVRVMTCQQSDQ